MKSVCLLTSCLAVSLLCLSAAPVLRPHAPVTFHRENVLGTSFELKVVASSDEAAGRAESAALEEISREQGILSSWDSESEFSKWFRTQGQPVPVSPELFEVLSLFDTWRLRTNGALDASAEAVTRVWNSAARQGREPSAEERAGAVAAVKQTHWILDPAKGAATHLSEAPLALNSFVKSYIMDHAADAALAIPEVTSVVLNIGGDLVIRGGWTEPINIADPRSDAENSAPLVRLRVRDRAIATSGGYRRGFDIAGRHYSHIVDPRTGQPAGHILSATVISSNPTDAGALATAFCVLTSEESWRLAASMNIEYLLITEDGDRVASPGWKQFEVAAPAMAVAAKPAPRPMASPEPQTGAAAADAPMELTVNFELAQVGGYARRPYVAVWIEDKDHFPVRTLALWYLKGRWLPDLRTWYRDDRVRATAEGTEITASVASATRPPGKYTVKWDGKDSAGKPVKPGKYTVLIETAREHGPYQIMQQEVDLNRTPKQFALPGNGEVSSASVDYHRAGR